MELFDRRGKPIRYARDVRYDNVLSGLSAEDVQAAIDELVASNLANLSLVTISDETGSAPNSRRLVAGTNVTFNTSTPGQIIINASGGGGGGQVDEIVGTPDEIVVDNTDPTKPVLSLDPAVTSALGLALTAVQPGDLAAVAFTGDYDDLSNTPSIPSAANPSASVGLSAVNGSADTFMRSDAAPALDQGISPTWTGEHTFTMPTTFTDDVLISGDNVELQIGEEADLRLYHDGTNSVIRNGSGALSIVGVTGDVAPVNLPASVDLLLTGTAFGHFRSGANNGAVLYVGLYRGSFAAPTSPVVGTGLGFINFTAHDGATDLRTAAQFAAIASEEWIPGVAHGANWRVQTVAAGSTAIQNRMLVGANAIGGFVQGPDGVAAQPGWSFLDDPDTGICRPNTNELGIAAGGALVMRIDSRGVVWIRDGITAPGASITGMAGLYIDSADGDLKIRFADGTVKTIVTDT